ncbi:MAG: hypothetical protein R3190_17685, partial [Thermoanaerobaculia bacterium]|nr:hypothetical protein [Thermoanaerobaculia bacterium]
MSPSLASRYLGLELRNPLVASSSPMTADLEHLRRLDEAGVGAVVLPSLFQEEIEHDELAVHGLHEHGAESFYEATSYQPDLGSYDLTGRVIAITGPTSGLGMAAAEQFAAQGATLVLVARN